MAIWEGARRREAELMEVVVHTVELLISFVARLPLRYTYWNSLPNILMLVQ